MEPGSQKNGFKLKLTSKAKKPLKRTAIELSSSESDVRPTKRSVPNQSRPKETPSSLDLDSFLNDLPDTGNNTQSGIEVVSDLLEDNSIISTRSKASESTLSERLNKRTSKLEKIHANVESFHFDKAISHGASTVSTDPQLYREEHGIHLDAESPDDFAPIQAWHAASLPLPMVRVVEINNFKKPTPIQAQSLPVIMRGYDMLGIAPTGSGKTVAFSIPLCRHVSANMSNYKTAGAKGPFALILVPTRELCIQIQRELDPWAASLSLQTLSCYGGSDIISQISALVNHKCDIMIATPGRLIDLLAANNGRVLSLSSVTFLVVDETDRMFDLGFGPQVRKIVECVRPDRQTVVFSATLPKPLEGLILRILHEPVKVQITRSLQENRPQGSYTVPAEVDQKAELFQDEKAKYKTLVDLLRNSIKGSSSLVFVNTQTLADSLALKLNAEGFACRALHGGMDQRDRDDVITEFTAGSLPVIVATSVAARGLDVKNLKLIINYDPASHVEDYIHRAGRTGRAGEKGSCVSLLLPNQGKEAYYLSGFMNLDEDLKNLSESYGTRHRDDSKEEAPKFTGFGGHGLAMLDHKREAKASVEKGAHDEAGLSIPPMTTELLDDAIKQNGENSFSARFVVNELPRDVRIAVTSAATQSEISENYHVSLTLKGVFMATPKSNSDADSKLHVLIEGYNRENVVDAYNSIQAYANEKLTGRQAQEKYASF